MKGVCKRKSSRQTPDRKQKESILLPLILNQLENNLPALKLRMLHTNLHRMPIPRHKTPIRHTPHKPTIQIHRPTTTKITGTSWRGDDTAICAGARQTAPVVEADDIMTWYDLPQASVHGIADFDEVLVEEDEEFPVQTGCVGAADELHDHAAGDVAVFVDVDGAFGVGDEELAVAEAEHAQRSEVFDAVGDRAEVGLCLGVGLFGAEIGDGPGLFLVDGEDFDATVGGDGEGRVEHVDAVAFSGDVEFVVFAKEFGLGAARVEEAVFVAGGFLKDGFQDLEG